MTIGTTPDYMGPWEKLQLGWLDYAVVSQGDEGTFTLSPAARQATDQEQAVVIDVPDEGIETTYVTPFSGSNAWWTSSADDLNTTLTRSIDLTGVPSATLTAKAWYDIEAGFDFLYAEYSTDDGLHWKRIGDPLDGSSKASGATSSTRSPAGDEILFRFRYQTDGGVHLPGAFLDDFTLKRGGTTLFLDDVEAGQTAGPPTAASRSAPAPRPRLAIATTSPRTERTSTTTRPLPRARTSSASRSPHRTRSSASRSRTGCSSGWSTRRTRTTTPSIIRATG